jgi:hypothetical protein
MRKRQKVAESMTPEMMTPEAMKKNMTWLRLVSYCAAWVLAGSLVMAALLASASLAFGFNPGQAGDPPNLSSSVAVSGVISDSHCGAKHAANLGKNSAECVRLCKRRGAKYVMVNGTTTYTLVGNQSKFEAFAGQRAQVNGTLNGETLNVTSIQAQ